MFLASYSQPITIVLASPVFAVCCYGISLCTWCVKTLMQENLWHCDADSAEHSSRPQAQDVLLPWPQRQLFTFTDLACYWNVGYRALFAMKRWKVCYILWLLSCELYEILDECKEYPEKGHSCLIPTSWGSHLTDLFTSSSRKKKE